MHSQNQINCILLYYTFYTTNLTRLYENFSSNLPRFMNLSRSSAASNRSS